jgi:5-methylcytosine-specific restriction endonuclease McrA
MSARDLSNHLAVLLRKEREAMADSLLALADFDAKKLWRHLGHASLFYYLRRELGLSAGAAQHRKTAVELIQQLPAVEVALREGRLCLSSVCELAKVVTPENVAEVLPRFFGLSRREAEVVSASIRPATAIPEREVVTPARAPIRTPDSDVRPDVAPADPVHPGEVPLRMEMVLTSPAAAAATRPPDSEHPLTAELSRFHITVSRRFMETLERTKDALSHSHPGASTEEILMACMQAMLVKKAKQKGFVERPLKKPRPSRPDHIPAHVRRAVMERSGERCEWVLENGERCNSTYQVECDHIVPKALGGRATVENTRAACRAHNQLAARRVFGDAFMDRFTRTRRQQASPSAPRSAAAYAGSGSEIRGTPGLRRPELRALESPTQPGATVAPQEAPA